MFFAVEPEEVFVVENFRNFIRVKTVWIELFTNPYDCEIGKVVGAWNDIIRPQCGNKLYASIKV
jgi:hypothetical protein